jgi:hypothetical protein
MSELNWRDAIIRVLRGSPDPMHYTDIAEAIAEQGLRTEFGATPAASVNATISVSMQNEGDHSPFIRAGRGLYSLRDSVAPQPTSADQPTEEPDETGLINAFGMYWARSYVLWTSTPRILGQQQSGSTPVDFCNQRGVYLLHDGRAVVYVGRTTEQALGVRLRQHISDRLNGRWDRFSWFGVYPVTESGALDVNVVGAYNIDMLIVTMEALLIEGLEPPQNRRRGDDFRAVEFLQVEDPDIQKTQIVRLMDELKKKL